MRKPALLVAVIAASLTTQHALGGILAGPIINPANGHCYYLLTTNSWTASEAEAITLGGHLATINDATEDAWVYSNFSQFGGGDRGLWIGLNDAAQEGTFVWASGEPVGYLNWAQAEPNDQEGLTDYVHLFYPSDTAGRASLWNDAPDSFFEPGISFNGVVEVCKPELTIRLSQVEVCFTTCTNMTYQIQCRPSLGGGLWSDLGTPISGDGTVKCIKDDVPPSEPQKYYRVVAQ